MPRTARLVAPGKPHHVIQRGNRRQQVFFCDDDRRFYLELLHTLGRRHGLKFWAYCLMDNHVHLIVVPEREESLSEGLGAAHSAYSRHVNWRQGWRGCLWQCRFSSFAMDERHTLAAFRYVERNPVRAGLCEQAVDFPWSSARPHARVVAPSPLLSRSWVEDEIGNWSEFLAEEPRESEVREIRSHARSGWPLGDVGFLDEVQKQVGRPVQPARTRRLARLTAPAVLGASK